MRKLALAMMATAWAAVNLATATTGATTKPADVNNAIAVTLLRGDSAARLEAMKKWVASSPTGFSGLDVTLLPAVAKCADDPSPQTRSEAATLIGCAWIQSVSVPNAQAVTIEEKLARDTDAVVRHDAVAAGLKPIKNKPDAVVDALIDAAMGPAKYDYRTSVQTIFGLQNLDKQRLIVRLEPFWARAKTDPERAAWAYALFVGATNEDPPNAGRLDNVGVFAVPFNSRGGYSRAEIDADLRKLIPATVSREWYLSNFRGASTGAVIVRGVAARKQVISDLATSAVVDCAPSRWCDLVTPDYLSNLKRENAAATTAPEPASPETYAPAFKQLYDYLGQVYPNFKMKGIDWKAVGDQLLPRSRQVRTQREFGLLVEELVARLQDSHAVVETGSVQPPEPDLPRWDPGIICLIDDRDRPVIFFIEPNSSAQKAGIKIGMAVVSVNGIAAEDAMRNYMKAVSQYSGNSSERVLRYYGARQFLYQQRRGSMVSLILEDPSGKRLTVEIPADYDGDRFLQRLPILPTGITDADNISWTHLPDNIGYIHLHRIRDGLEEEIDAALRDIGQARGLIIDVRGNTGGGFDEERALRNFDLSPQDSAEPQRPRYRGPIALLIDEGCISAGEGWSSWFIANHRAKVFGTTTAGASSAKETYTLSNGLYTVIVPIKDYTGFLNRAIERRGLEPDVAVRCNARDLAQGRDTVMEAATRWLLSSP